MIPMNNIIGSDRLRGFEKTADAPYGTRLPQRGTEFAAGYDFFAPEDITIPAHGFSPIIKTYVKAYMQEDEYLGITIRSSLATTKGRLMVSQGEAVVDADYYGNPDNDGNIGIVLWNRGGEDFLIRKGERFCQGIFKKYKKADKDEPLKTRRNGGYGSTGR